MDFAEARRRLVDNLIKKGYIKSEQVKNAMLKVPRELFVPANNKNSAYFDTPLQTLEGQTISAPHMNAMMCELLELKPGMKVLEIGTGSGYHAALCAELVRNNEKKEESGHVFTIERKSSLVEFARENLKNAGYNELVTVILSDGTEGYEKAAPYDRILVTAAGPEVPRPLIEQLKDQGILIIPVGNIRSNQNLEIIKKIGDKIKRQTICGVIFVPLIGKHGFHNDF